jgi:superfamily II DNA helicase RecQ
MVLSFSSPAFDDEPIPPDAADNVVPNEAEYLDNCPLDEGLQLLHDKTGVQLRNGQKWALSRLHGGIDTLLVAKTGFGNTLIFTGFHLLLLASKRAITLIISPLMAIEQDQALDFWRCLPVARR